MRPEDTTPEAWTFFLDLHRRMTAEEKLARCLEWSEVTRRFAEAGLRERYPGADDREILLRFARLTLGPDLFRRAYGEALPDEPACENP